MVRDDQSSYENVLTMESLILQRQTPLRSLCRRSMNDLDIVQVVGESHLSTVVLCRCSRSGLPLAVKMYHKDRMAAHNQRQVLVMACVRMRGIIVVMPYDWYAHMISSDLVGGCEGQVAREIRLHARLQHAYVIALYAAFEDECGVYLVLVRVQP